MSQFREHAYPQTSPASFSGPVESSNVGGTPTRLIAFSPSATSKSASKILQTPDRDSVDGSQKPVFSPTQSSGGFRTTGLPADNDPFVTPTSSKSKGNNNNNQPLSATASSFRPFYGHLPSDDSDENLTKGKGRAKDEAEDDRLPDKVSSALSNELQLSRCVEISCPTQAVSKADIESYLAKLSSLGSPCKGHKKLYTMNGKVFLRLTNIRDACVVHRNIHLCGSDWVAKFISPPDFAQTVAPGENIAALHEGQLDMLAVLLYNATVDVSQLEPMVFNVLQKEGDLFAFKKGPRSDEGTVKAIIEYADINVALAVTGKLNGLMVDQGLHMRLDFYQPNGHTGRAAPSYNGVTTPMATPMSYPPHEQPMAYPSPGPMPYVKTPLPPSSAMVPVRHQATPPTSGVGGPPQVALVPMVVRNPYSPGTPLILDPYGQPHAMGPMGHNQALVLPPAGQMPMTGPHGYEPMPRPLSVSNRYGGRRGSNSMRMDGSSHYNPNGHHNQVDINRIREGVDVRTTIMLRNIPNKVDQRMLKAIIDESSWGKYDFMYLRIDFANDCNVGYAFINFADPLDIIDFANARDNQHWNCFRSDKVAEISYATIQGRDCLVQKFRNSSVMLEAPHYRPKLYFTVNGTNPELAGREEEFPGPDNPSKMKRSCENAEHVGLFTPHLGQYFREEQRRRRSQYDRGTRMAALEEYDYESALQRVYMPR